MEMHRVFTVSRSANVPTLMAAMLDGYFCMVTVYELTKIQPECWHASTNRATHDASYRITKCIQCPHTSRKSLLSPLGKRLIANSSSEQK
ncbi:hypothetical protein Y032_0030g2161 [Ancylostoma ceylanicum]|uniref:Uncharacterized protein n=1 Tax=Ancylostoma ceylanicum TaxID=53326 RepID=A0A016UR04_9BILA|nr:hypothetical protein Y032_0030g2161 [Ancylostoma ceylanicum]